VSNRAVALAFLLCLMATGCGADAPPEHGPSPSPSPSAAGPTVPENLTFTGALAGHMSSGAAGDLYVCVWTGGNYVAGPILGVAGGRQVQMSITKVSFNGAGTYPAGGVSFDSGADHYYPATGAGGTLMVGSDLRSGAVDISLAADTDPNTVVGRVSGTWRCPPDTH
jgi:hypothetical protein